MWSNEEELTQVRESELIDVRFANAAEQSRKVSKEFDIIIRSEKMSLLDILYIQSLKHGKYHEKFRI